MKIKYTAPAYFALQGSYWMSISVVNGYAAVFLQGRGYSNFSLGLVLALGNVLGFLLAPYLAALVDRAKRITIYHCLWALLLVQGVIALGFIVLPGSGILISILYCVYMAASVAVNPMNTELCFELSHWYRPVSYGPARGTGSLCYALMAVLLGQFTLQLGPEVLPFAGLFCLLFQLLSLGLICLAKRRADVPMDRPAEMQQAGGHGLMDFIRANERFCILMLSLSLLFISYSLTDLFLINTVRSVGGNTGDLGGISGFKALMEIPIMMLYPQLTRRFRCSSVICFSAVGFVARVLMMSLAGSVAMLYAAHVLQAISFALLIPASVQYVNLVIAPEDSAKGQAIANGTLTLGSVFASLIGGQLFDHFSARFSLLIGVIIAVMGMILCFISVERKKA